MRVLVTPRSFAKHDPKPYYMLLQQGYEIVGNPHSRPFTKKELTSVIKDVEGIIVGVESLNKNIIESLRIKSNSKIRCGVLDNIDMEYAKERGIKVSKTKGAIQML